MLYRFLPLKDASQQLRKTTSDTLQLDQKHSEMKIEHGLESAFQ